MQINGMLMVVKLILDNASKMQQKIKLKQSWVLK